MAITVGLDFGTHQTKICIENSDNPLHKTYEFYKWENGKFAFPSVIQINTDHTINYGNIDLDKCLYGKKLKNTEPPKLNLPPQPKIPDIKPPRLRMKPPMPVANIEINGEVISMPYSELYGIGKEYIPKIDFKEYRVWKNNCDEIMQTFLSFHDWWEKITDLCPEMDYPEPQMPFLPKEPFLEGFDYNFHPAMLATKSQYNEYVVWQRECEIIDKRNAILRAPYELAMKKYQKELEEWKEKCAYLEKIYSEQLASFNEISDNLPLIYRYFKQATFAAYKWDYEIPAKDLSVLYLAFIIFKLEERFGTDFSIQMGIPASKNTFARLKKIAAGHLIQAFRLVEDVFHNDMEKFLSTPYEELLSLIPTYEYSDELKIQYGLIILPEAYAALRSLTSNARIPKGMSIMLDMGGGTTDISFFVIEENGEPHIYHFESISKGLNFFLEYEDRHQFKIVDVSKKKELENVPTQAFNNAFSEFKGNLDTIIRSLTNFLHQDTISRGFTKSAFRDAVMNRPAIYTGGGCYDNRMRKPIMDFTDVMYIDKEILSIPNIVDEKDVTIPYSLMATAFGLSIQKLDDEIEVSRKEELFSKFSNEDETQKRWNAHREHGMYED